ncbi:MAG: hypothetical protein AAFW60_13345 [Pseudomonadota bacterium]
MCLVLRKSRIQGERYSMAIYVECNQYLDEIKRQIGLVADPSGNSSSLQFLQANTMTLGDHVAVNLYTKIAFPTGSAGTDLGAQLIEKLANQTLMSIFIHGVDGSFSTSTFDRLGTETRYELAKDNGLTITSTNSPEVNIYVNGSSTNQSYAIKIGFMTWTNEKPFVLLYHELKHAEGDIYNKSSGHWKLIPEVNEFRTQRQLGYERWRM